MKQVSNIRTPALRVSLLCSMLVLAGCVSFTPDYQRPDAPVPAQFGTQDKAGSNVSAADLDIAALDWESVLLDARLRQVIQQALTNNRDLRVAILNVEKTRAQYRVQDAAIWPSVNATGSQSAARSASGSGNGQVSRSASLEVGVSSWELDLFGRVGSLRQQALETFLAMEQTQRSTRMSLVASVADAWLSVAANQGLLALAKQTLQSQSRTLELTELRHKEGIVSGVDLATVQSSVESARVDVARYDTELAQARNALDLLVGAAVTPDLLPPSGQALDTSVALADIPANLSSTVLLRRPDVLAAEFALKAANANIGAARAAFFPTISLTAAAGVGSSDLSGLFDNATRVWSFVPQVSLPIFNAGSLQAELDSAKVARDITVAEYEKSIQTAFSEVADALDVRRRIAARMTAQQALVDASARAYQLADARYRNGVDSYLETLTAQRTLYAAHQGLVTLEQTEASNRVALYKVLGGGADIAAAVVPVAQSDAAVAQGATE